MTSDELLELLADLYARYFGTPMEAGVVVTSEAIREAVAADPE